MNITNIPELIRTARKGRSQADFAQELGISQSTLCRYENRHANPKAEVIERCMRLVHFDGRQRDLSIDELVDKVRSRLGREDQGALRVALSEIIDGFDAGNGAAHAMSQHPG
ncbi:MAG: helix-turn-helix domain-containing protein [Betaproteobacteria bacterium]|nr:helix-turn-helix domain-containing protein [Betaproteobacteria bacterium]